MAMGLKLSNPLPFLMGLDLMYSSQLEVANQAKQTFILV